MGAREGVMVARNGILIKWAEVSAPIDNEIGDALLSCIEAMVLRNKRKT